MPYGCGEQNMITFVPNIFVVKYLETIGSLSVEDFNLAQEHMLVGEFCFWFFFQNSVSLLTAY